MINNRIKNLFYCMLVGFDLFWFVDASLCQDKKIQKHKNWSEIESKHYQRLLVSLTRESGRISLGIELSDAQIQRIAAAQRAIDEKCVAKSQAMAETRKLWEAGKIRRYADIRKKQIDEIKSIRNTIGKTIEKELVPFQTAKLKQAARVSRLIEQSENSDELGIIAVLSELRGDSPAEVKRIKRIVDQARAKLQAELKTEREKSLKTVMNQLNSDQKKFLKGKFGRIYDISSEDQ